MLDGEQEGDAKADEDDGEDGECDHQCFQPGERVVNRGEVADRIFIMLTGRVVLSEQDQHDEEETVVELAPDELIGEMGLVTDTVYAFDG